MTITGVSSPLNVYTPVQPVRAVQAVGSRGVDRSSRGASQSTGSAQASELDRTSSQAGSITITTAEGDKVTLSFAAQNAQHAAAYQAQGSGDSASQTQGAGSQSRAHRGHGHRAAAQTNSGNQAISGAESSSQSASQVNVQVDGNLSDKELADIQKVIQAYGDVAAGKSSLGDLSRQFDSLDSLSTAQLSYQQTSQTAYSSVQVYG